MLSVIFSNDKDLNFLQQNWFKTKGEFIQKTRDFKIIKTEPIGVLDHVSLSTTTVRPRNSLKKVKINSCANI